MDHQKCLSLPPPLTFCHSRVLSFFGPLSEEPFALASALGFGPLTANIFKWKCKVNLATCRCKAACPFVKLNRPGGPKRGPGEAKTQSPITGHLYSLGYWVLLWMALGVDVICYLLLVSLASTFIGRVIDLTRAKAGYKAFMSQLPLFICSSLDLRFILPNAPQTPCDFEWIKLCVSECVPTEQLFSFERTRERGYFLLPKQRQNKFCGRLCPVNDKWISLVRNEKAINSTGHLCVETSANKVCPSELFELTLFASAIFTWRFDFSLSLRERERERERDRQR